MIVSEIYCGRTRHGKITEIASNYEINLRCLLRYVAYFSITSVTPVYFCPTFHVKKLSVNINIKLVFPTNQVKYKSKVYDMR